MGRTSNARERLIQGAIDLIYARSYSAVGVQEICDHAGVKKGSFYHFFPSKLDLSLAALDELEVRLRERIIMPAFMQASIPPLERIGRFFDLLTELQIEIFESSGKVLGCPLGNLALEMSTQDEVLRKRLDNFFRHAEQYIESSLEAAVAEGSAPDIDTRAAAQAVFAFMEGLLLIAKTRNDPSCITSLGRGAIALALSMKKEISSDGS